MPAGSTYTPIATTTLASATGSYTFSSIPSTYTDLVLIVNPKASVSNMGVRFNSDSGTNYGDTWVYGDGTSALSTRDTSGNRIYQTITAGNVIIKMNIMNYANTTTFKTTLSRTDDAANGLTAIVGTWRSTAAINSVTVLAGTGNLPVGTDVTLYGIASA
jgi:hypothetical protein